MNKSVVILKFHEYEIDDGKAAKTLTKYAKSGYRIVTHVVYSDLNDIVNANEVDAIFWHIYTLQK